MNYTDKSRGPAAPASTPAMLNIGGDNRCFRARYAHTIQYKYANYLTVSQCHLFYFWGN